MPSTTLANLLGQHLQRAHTSVNRLAILSGIPQRTIANWLNGYIQKPHQWQSLVKVAFALRLNVIATNELLRVAGHPSLPELRAKAITPSDIDLLSKFHSPTSKPAPFQAIADLPTFVGRTSELEDLKQSLLTGKRAAICSLRGMGGVGKTSLAAHLAYQLRGEFPDGVLWARLDTSDTLSILGAFADAYGKDVSQYKDIESRASVVRNLLAEKRTLIILDNAETSAQVRPILPASTGNSAVLITTRHDLSALDGWTRLTLKSFDAASEETLQLFENYLGQNFVCSHRTTLLEISSLLGCLPLALAITAGQLANNLPLSSGATNAVTALLDSLRKSHARLDILTRDDLGIRASFDVSYIALTPFQQDLFSTLGIFSGDDFGSEAVAYLTDQTPDQADTELKHLQSLSLVQESRDSRWRLHPLLQDYAREKLGVTNKLIPVVEKTLLMYRQAVQGQWAFVHSLDAEISNIHFALNQASQLKLYQPLLETVQAIYPTLSIGAWFPLAHTALEQACTAAHILGNLKAEIFLLRGLSFAQMGLGDNKNAQQNLRLALQLAHSLNRDEDVIDILILLGKLEHDTGHRRQANIYFEESLALARKINSSNNISRILSALAVNILAEARYAEAETMLLEALELSRAQKQGNMVHKILMNLGEAYWHLGDLGRAATHWQEALSLAKASKHRAATVGLLASLAGIHILHSEWSEAELLSEEGIQLALKISSPRMESIARCELGYTFYKQKKYNAALDQLQRAKELAIEAGDMERKGIILRYLGLLYLDRLQLEEACIALNEALSIAKEINHEIMIADTYFVQAKVALAGGACAKAEQWARESSVIYERLGLARQSEEVRRWNSPPN